MAAVGGQLRSTRALVEYLDSAAAGVGVGEPGFSAVLLHRGEVVHERHHGLACMELGVPLSGRSAYYLGSESKPFTAACVLDLVRQGAVGLDDDVCQLLPETRQFEAALPLRSLLNHSSGIPDYFEFLGCQLGRHESDYFDNALLLRLIGRMESLQFQPGEKHAYSNSNYILLAALVKAITGESLARQARARLWEPLGLHGIGFDEDRLAVLPHRVRSYEPDASRSAGYKQHLGNANTVGDGGVYACSDDLVRWERHWHRQWAEPGSLVHAMLQPSALNDGSVPSYRFGIELLSSHGLDIVFHGGGLWGFGALILRVPAWGLSVVQLSNNDKLRPDMAPLLGALHADLGTDLGGALPT